MARADHSELIVTAGAPPSSKCVSWLTLFGNLLSDAVIMQLLRWLLGLTTRPHPYEHQRPDSGVF
jgi:hypothetical protein